MTFFLRMEYLGKGDSAKYDDIGMWAVSTNRDTLVLFGNAAAPVKLAIRDANTLRKLSPQDTTIKSSLNYDLKRTTNTRPSSRDSACVRCTRTWPTPGGSRNA